jgi:hypothetical protein
METFCNEYFYGLKLDIALLEFSQFTENVECLLELVLSLCSLQLADGEPQPSLVMSTFKHHTFFEVSLATDFPLIEEDDSQPIQGHDIFLIAFKHLLKIENFFIDLAGLLRDDGHHPAGLEIVLIVVQDIFENGDCLLEVSMSEQDLGHCDRG